MSNDDFADMKSRERIEAEEYVKDAVACLYNIQYNKQKSWEECFKELAIGQQIRIMKLQKALYERETK